MTLFRRNKAPAGRSRPRQSIKDKPNVEKAREDLARVKRQRRAVEELVAALRREQQLNNFTANITANFRGGRP